MSTRLPTYFISHGGGPWPYLDGPFRRMFDQLEQSLQDVRREIGDAPRAVLVISAHWEENGFAISSRNSRAWSMITPAFRRTPIRSSIRRPDRRSLPLV